MTQEYLSQESGSHLFKMQTSREVAPVPQFLWVGGQEPNFSGRFVASCKTPSCREDTPPPRPRLEGVTQLTWTVTPKTRLCAMGCMFLATESVGFLPDSAILLCAPHFE